MQTILERAHRFHPRVFPMAFRQLLLFILLHYYKRFYYSCIHLSPSPYYHSCKLVSWPFCFICPVYPVRRTGAKTTAMSPRLNVFAPMLCIPVGLSISTYSTKHKGLKIEQLRLFIRSSDNLSVVAIFTVCVPLPLVLCKAIRFYPTALCCDAATFS